MRLLVCGGRNFNDRFFLCAWLDRLHAERPASCVITGGARGADTLAAEWARSRGIQTSTFPANWTEHGYAAGPIRNQRMLDEGRPDMVVSFQGGRGTADMTRRARAAGLHVVQVFEPPPAFTR